MSGFGEKEETPINAADEGSKLFSEQKLYIHQTLKGIYAITKFKAELAVLEAIADGLDAQIIRIGNITNRYSDGHFQKNIDDNAFVQRIKSFIQIGAFPEEMLKHRVEFTPVDVCADAIIKILEYHSPCNVFHFYHPNAIEIKLCYNFISNLGFKFVPVSNELMSHIVSGILTDDGKKNLLSGIIQDLDSSRTFNYMSKVKLESNFTNKYLRKIGFHWPILNQRYLEKSFQYFEDVNFITKPK